MRLSIRNSDEIIYPENIYCVGWNYHAHAEELNNLVPKEPIIFLKSNSCLAKDSKVLKLPIDSAVVHYEGELFVVIKYDCGRIDEITAEKLILGYGVGIDYTLREIQNEAKRKGEPWTISKSFFGSAPISEIVLKEEVKNIYEKKIQLKVNGELRQDEYLNNMVFKIPYLISFLSHHLPLKRGDIIFTGTPKGVGKVNSGDKIICSVNDLVELRSHVL